MSCVAHCGAIPRSLHDCHSIGISPGPPVALGLVAFGGIGEVAPDGDGFRTDQFLPAGGTGIRFLLSKKFHVNLRTDFAWGKDNFTWSMGVGEAF